MDSSKRRRVDNSTTPRTPRTPIQRKEASDSATRSRSRSRSPIESSSDELAAGSDHDEERRRTSWTIQKTYPPKRPYPRSRSFSGSESSDELAVDAGEYWRSRNRGRRSPTHEQSNMSSRGDGDGDGDGERYDEGEGEVGEVGELDYEAGTREIDAEREGEGEDGDARGSDRSPTPVPPPKPDRLNYKQKYLLKGHLRGVSAVRFSPDATMLASAGADGAIKVWDTLSGNLIHTFEGHLAGVSTIAWSPDCATIASGSDDKTIRLWNVLTGKAHPIPFVGHHNYVYQIAFSPKGNMLASGSYDEAVFLWDVRSARVMKSLPAHSDPVGGIDVVWDGTLVASCATDGLVRIWDTATGQCLRTLVHEDNPPVTSVKFSPNGKFVLAWTLDDCVRLWDYVDGRCIKTYQGHANRKYSITGAFGVYGFRGAGTAPDAFAVSGSEDGDILCWDVVNKKILQRVEGHEGVVLGVDTCCIQGRRLMVSCGLDRTVRVWEEEDDNDDDTGDATPTRATHESEIKTEEPVTTSETPQQDNAPDTDMMDVEPTPEPPRENGVHTVNGDESNEQVSNGDVTME